MVYLATGFVMPRMIDHKLGQEVLGVWDFLGLLGGERLFLGCG